MAFNDIKAWRELMEQDEREKRAYDLACDAAEKRAAEMDRREWDEIDQAQVDLDSLGRCDCGDCRCLDDMEDDEIDFSAYGLGEADLGVGPMDANYASAHDLAREPLVRIPAAVGRPASDADLVAQNAVSLMAEAFKKILSGKNAEEPVDEEKEFEEADDEALLEDDKAPEADEKLEDIEQNDDYPLSDKDWDEINAEPDYGKKIEMIQAKIGERWASLSPEAKRQIRDDVTELRAELIKSRWSDMQFKEALRLQRLSREKELNDKEKEKFARIVKYSLDDTQRSKLLSNLYANGYRIPRLGRTTIVPHSDAQSGNGGAFASGENADEVRNETGLDSVHDMKKFEYVPEPMEPGETIPADFDPQFPGSVELRKRKQHEIDKIAAELLPGHEERKKAWMRRSAAALHDAGKDEELMDVVNDLNVWKKVVGALDPEEVEEIKQELWDELPFKDHVKKIMIDGILGGRTPTRKDIMAIWGVGGDQKGSTGMFTQNTDKEIGAILIGLAQHLNICQDDVTLTVRKDTSGNTDTKHYDSKIEAYQKNLRSEDTIPRERRKVLRQMFLDEILAELNFDPATVADELEAMPSYSMGRREKAAADKLVLLLLGREWNEMTQAEHAQFAEYLHGFSDRTEVRKLKTGLDPQQNSEFQTLISRMREEGDISDEDRIRLMQLDVIRKNPGAAEEQARTVAERMYNRMMQQENGEKEFLEYTTKLAKEFLRAKSGNITKDTITNPARAYAGDREDGEGQNA